MAQRKTKSQAHAWDGHTCEERAVSALLRKEAEQKEFLSLTKQ